MATDDESPTTEEVGPPQGATEDAAPTPDDGEAEQPPAAGPGKKPTHWIRNSTVAVAVVTLLGTLATGVLTLAGVISPPIIEHLLAEAPSPSASPSPEASVPPVTTVELEAPEVSPPAPSPVAVYNCEPLRNPDGTSPDGLAATVVYTEDLGVNSFCGPGNHYPRGTPQNYPESERVTIVCQVRDGAPVSDTPDVVGRYQGVWTVWNKLSNGVWVPDLYLDTPKEEGDLPPEGINLCDDLLT